MAKELTKTDTRKKAMLGALEKSLGIVTTACKAVGISRETHYEWLNTDPAYKQAVEALQDVVLDFAESALYKQIKEGSPTSTIFLLKTKGRKRGYIEKQEVEHTVKELPSWLTGNNGKP